MADMKSEGSTAVFKLFSYLGSSIAILGITLLASFMIGWWRGVLRGVSIIAGVSAANAFNLVLKMWIDRSRPVSAWGIEADGASFPSGNAMLAMVMFGLVACTIIQVRGVSGIVKMFSASAAFLLILMMGLSRVYFHVHYITDILGGYTAGMAVICLIMIILHAINKNRGATLR